MIEEEWLACEDPAELLEFLRAGPIDHRKMRLFGCASLRVVWSLTGEKLPRAVETAEQFADRSVTKAALRRARGDVRQQRYALEEAEAGMRPLWGAYWLTE